MEQLGEVQSEKLRRMLLHGTTTVGLRTREFTVLAADRRATAGYYIAHKRARKILKIRDYIWVTTAGLVADAQMLVDWIRHHLDYYELITHIKPSVSVAVNILSTILFSARLFPFIVQLVIGGYDSEPRLYTLDWYGAVTEEKYTATGSGSPIAIGVLEEGYREDLREEEAVKLARDAVVAATRRDAFSGNGVDVVVIGKGWYREYKFELSR